MAQYEHLVEFIQDYAISRFDFIDKPVVLEFAEFFRQIGLWRWDQYLVRQIETHF